MHISKPVSFLHKSNFSTFFSADENESGNVARQLQVAPRKSSNAIYVPLKERPVSFSSSTYG